MKTLLAIAFGESMSIPLWLFIKALEIVKEKWQEAEWAGSV